MIAGSRIRQIGWALVLALCFGMLLALTFKVNAVKSDVRLIERKIIAAEQSKLMLETEFQTRASQHQLADWNTIEFGYAAPRADQYLENERQLAALGSPRGLDAPSPIRVAMNTPVDAGGESLIPVWFADSEAHEENSAPSDNPIIVREAVRSTLAQRLTRPAASVVAVAEVAP